MAHVYLYVLLICPALLVAAYFLVLDGRPPAAPEVTTAESSSFAAAPSLRGASSSAAAAAAAAVASSSSPLSYPSSAAPRPPAAEAPASIAAATAATTATTAAAPVATSQQPPGGRTSSCATPCKTLSNGVEMPLLLYGTAWKEGRTEALVAQALRLGFRGVDTANQKRHYNEEGVGRALAKAVAAGDVRRSELFLQSKFTFPRGHSPGQEPYSLESSSSSSSASSSSSSSSSSPLSSSGSASASSGSAETTTGRQVRESFASSLKHLGTTYLDSYIIHGPLRHGTTLSGADLDAWRALEALYATGKVRAIGVSNFGQEQLRALAARAAVKPHVAQIRTFAARGWDDRTGGVRAACEELGVVFQVGDPYVRTEARHI
jgi:diketogulonate reductase-like aldo/keto reductase